MTTDKINFKSFADLIIVPCILILVSHAFML